jgi:hypothetical protein
MIGNDPVKHHVTADLERLWLLGKQIMRARP